MKKLLLTIVSLIVVTAMAAALVAWDKIHWRTQIIMLKAGGDIEELSWSETIRWMMPGTPVYLNRLLVNSNPGASLENAVYVTPRDVDAGEQIFRANCAACHGLGGEGVSGPPLNTAGRTANDWELYRLIQKGIPGTSMPAHDLKDPGIWQVMTYLKTLINQGIASHANKTMNLQAVGFERLKDARSEPNNWLTYSGTYDGIRFSDLSDINASNVNRLALQWAYQMNTTYRAVETNPIVSEGIMFVTEPPGKVMALDAVSGELLWAYQRPIPEDMILCCGVVNRGVAVLGDTVLVATIDAHLLALDMRTGLLRWQVEVGDHKLGYSITSAPLALDGMVVTGIAGGESGVQGYLDAYDVHTGERKWRFHTIPGVGEAGRETWREEATELRGNATWMTGSYDPDLNLIYWGTGHPVQSPAIPTGDKLYSCSMLAVDAATGDLVWHFQFTPDDVHGFDATQVPMLVDTEIEGQQRRLLITANRNGFYYVLDRESGEFVLGTPFAKQSWAKGLDNNGRPLSNPEARPTMEGVLSTPGSVGATNWWPPAYNPKTKQIYVPAIEMPSVFYAQEDEYQPGEYLVHVVGRQQLNQPAQTMIRSLDALSGELVWETMFPKALNLSRSTGIVATAGGLLFTSNNKTLYALNSADGEILWSVNTGGEINAAPVTYRTDGQQFVIISAGRALMAFALLDGGAN